MATKTAPKLESSATPADLPTSPAGEGKPAPGPAQEQTAVNLSPAPVPVHWLHNCPTAPPIPIAGSAHSEQVGALMAALAEAQGGLRGALKDAQNPHLRNKYADLSSVWAAWQDVGPECGLALVQTTEANERTVTVTTMLGHNSGQWVRGSLTLPWSAQKGITDAQAIGSALTYARRYGLAALVGVCPEDDDGNTAGRPAEQPRINGNGANGNGKPAPAAERREARMVAAPANDDLRKLKGEVWKLVVRYCGVHAEDGAVDEAATKVSAGHLLLAANLDTPIPRVAVDADGLANLTACSAAQLQALKAWLETAILDADKREDDPF